MNKYYIFTDSTCDLASKFYEDDFKILPLTCYINEKEFIAKNSEDFEKFYNDMEKGTLPTTSMVNPTAFATAFEKVLKDGNDVLCIAFSSALSGTYQSAVIAKNELTDKYPNNKIIVIDSKCASGGEGLLIYYALKKRREGASITENAEYIENLKVHLHHDFTVDNLFHLYRGGRVAKSAAIIGTALHVKPVLVCDTEGRLTPIGKVQGRKLALHAMVNKMKEKIGDWDNEVVFISHGGCKKDAEWVANKIKKELGITNIVIDYVGPVIGSHCGKGVLALFYLADDREK